MRRIAFINEKGGSCKTTLAVNIGAYFVLKREKRVLIVDLDSQGHAGKSLGLDVRNMRPTMFDLLAADGVALSDVVRRSSIQKLDVIPANKSMADFPLAVASSEDRAFRLRKRLSGLRGYDFVLFDPPPSLGLTTTNVLLAAEEVVIPVSLTYLAMDGCAEIIETINMVKDCYGAPELRISLVVPTLYRPTLLAREIIEKLRQHFGKKLSTTIMGFNVKIDEAQSHGKTIWEYAPSSTGAEIFTALAEEILNLQANQR